MCMHTHVHACETDEIQGGQIASISISACDIALIVLEDIPNGGKWVKGMLDISVLFLIKYVNLQLSQNKTFNKLKHRVL